MKRLLPGLFFCLPFFVNSQDTGNGIQWTKGLSFAQVKQKAKLENKYILLDCYTTWCTPCKKMDAEVYPVDSVGKFINQHFLPVKVQFDRSSQDDETVKLWYSEIRDLEANYYVDGYPTFIVLSPKGEPVYHTAGGYNAGDFIKMAQKAIDPNNGFKDFRRLYANLRDNYKKGIVKPDSLFFLLSTQRSSSLFTGDSIYRPEWNKKYMKYLAVATPAERYTKGNIGYWQDLHFKLSNPILKYCIEGESIIDSIMIFKGSATAIVARTISEQIAIPFFYQQEKDPSVSFTGMYLTGGSTNTAEADWKLLEKRIAKYFNKKIAKRFVLIMREEWYGRHQNDEGKISVWLKQLQDFPQDVGGQMNGQAINNVTFMKFMSSVNPDTLAMMASLMGMVTLNSPRINGKTIYSPGNLDTYASLLYKSGKRDDAIQWETKASERDPSFKKIADQMKKGYPIYLDLGVNWEGVNNVNWQGFVFPKEVNVKDEAGINLENVTIYNTRSGMRKKTNQKETSSIDVMLGDKIIISKEGYASQEVALTKSSDAVRVILKTQIKKGF